MSEGLKRGKSLKERQSNIFTGAYMYTLLIYNIANIDPIQIMQLRRVMDFAMRSRCNSLKQTSMLEHFEVL